MMGHREEIRTGDEKDVFSSYTKRGAGKKRGFRSEIKTKFNRRVRREVKADLKVFDLNEYYYYGEAEPKPRGWWTG